MVTDVKLIKKSLNKLVNYGYCDELTNFEECFNVELDEDHKTIDELLEMVEKIRGGKRHILYSILVLRSANKI